MANRQVNYTIPLYFDQSLSYLELVGNLEAQFQEVKDKTDNLLQAITYNKTIHKTQITGDLDVTGTISGNIEIGSGTITANVIGDLTGTADKALELDVEDTSATKPVRFVDGVPVEITGSLDNNCASANKWAQPITIRLTGGATSAPITIDGSGNVTIPNQLAYTPEPGSISEIPNDLEVKGQLTLSAGESPYGEGIYVEAGNVEIAGTGSFIGNLDGVASSATLAGTASKLSVNAGASDTPVYFSNGVPVQCASELAVNISGNAATATSATSATNATNATNATLARGTTAIQYGTENVSSHTFPAGYVAQAGDIYIKYIDE